MFKSPFSFNGRIRRMEYGLSFVIYWVVLLVGELLSDSADGGNSNGIGSVIFLIVLLPCLVFMIAQGVKRSHDLGNSGWFVIIPFYGLWLLFADSKPGINQYGANPKNIGNEPEFFFEHEEQQPRY